MSADDGSCGQDACGCKSGPADSPGAAGASLVDQLDNESGFHPMGEDWEDEMREMLDDTEYDTDLGMDMAQDAMRLVAGEIEEEDFYDQYHDAVVDEFEIDDRPMAELFDDPPDDATMVDSLKSLADTDVSRRDTMKKMGFAAGAAGLGTILPSEEEQEHDHGSDDSGATSDSTVAAQGDDVRYGMVIDLDRCDGCLECVIGCADENRTSSGANWMYVLTWEDETTEQENFLVRPCQHCSNAPCAKVCPVRARHVREEDGLVLTNYETCIGCRYCQVACPYGVNYFQWGEPEVPREELTDIDYSGSELRAMSPEDRQEVLTENQDHVFDNRGMEVDSRPRKGTMGKCTFCPTRQDGHMGEDMIGTVACMEACDDAGMSAIHFGDLSDEDSRPNRYLRRRQEMERSPADKAADLDDPEDWENPPVPHGTTQLSAFRLMEEIGTEPNVVYLGNEPGPTAEQVPPGEEPVTYESIQTRVDDEPRDIIDTRKDVTDAWTDLGALEEAE